MCNSSDAQVNGARVQTSAVFLTRKLLVHGSRPEAIKIAGPDKGGRKHHLRERRKHQPTAEANFGIFSYQELEKAPPRKSTPIDDLIFGAVEAGFLTVNYKRKNGSTPIDRCFLHPSKLRPSMGVGGLFRDLMFDRVGVGW